MSMANASRSRLNRVVVTGIGAVTPLALNFDDTWQALLAGECGLDFATKVDISRFHCKVAGEVRGFDPCKFLDAKVVRRSDSFTHYAVAAA
jgi:3-oxoacyl-[acyl-carrier-protein] synthase II